MTKTEKIIEHLRPNKIVDAPTIARRLGYTTSFVGSVLIKLEHRRLVTRTGGPLYYRWKLAA